MTIREVMAAALERLRPPRGKHGARRYVVVVLELLEEHGDRAADLDQARALRELGIRHEHWLGMPDGASEELVGGRVSAAWTTIHVPPSTGLEVEVGLATGDFSNFFADRPAGADRASDDPRPAGAIK